MRLIKLSITTFLSICFSFSSAQNDITIETTQLSNSVYMLKGQGGNIGLSVGEDGVFVIDDQFAPLTPKILEAIRQLSDLPIKYVVNTHFHGDHTGGNANFQKEGATIIAHDNVRARLLLPKRDGSNNPKEALPVLTFNDKLSIYINNEKVIIFHVGNAHTDGDALLYFTKSNVLHTGDNYFHKRYPYIDVKSGGSIDGYINAVSTALILIDDDTKIIPGHGELSNKEEYTSFLKMLKTLRANVQAEIDKGKSEQDIVNNNAITKIYDDLNYSWNFINSEKIRRAIYQSLVKN
jgi:glyoxylase-like metal-dependent hydrolase (beta-lactamase superfamily II)